MNTKDKILEFLKAHEECVIATVNAQGLPQAAVMGFSENNKLELMLATHSNTRKFKNISRHPYVAIVVGFEGTATVQYEGRVRVLEGKELQERQIAHFRKLPDAEKYKNDPEVYMSVTPTWVRYTDYSQKEGQIEELREFV